MNWNQAICRLCWNIRNPERRAVTLSPTTSRYEMCSDCGTPTKDGIYYRAHPDSVTYPTPDKDD